MPEEFSLCLRLITLATVQQNGKSGFWASLKGQGANRQNSNPLQSIVTPFSACSISQEQIHRHLKNHSSKMYATLHHLHVETETAANKTLYFLSSSFREFRALNTSDSGLCVN